MIYQHPLAFLLGLEGIALMRAFNGQYGEEFTRARIAEIRVLLDDAGRFGEGVETRPVTAAEGYAAWSGDYDQPNDLIDAEEPVMRRILGELPAGTALDAACGTGRHAAYLSSLGHAVVGVDICPQMLDVARAARAPVGHLDAPGLVPGRRPGREERRPHPDLLALPARARQRLMLRLTRSRRLRSR